MSYLLATIPVWDILNIMVFYWAWLLFTCAAPPRDQLRQRVLHVSSFWSSSAIRWALWIVTDLLHLSRSLSLLLMPTSSALISFSCFFLTWLLHISGICPQTGDPLPHHQESVEYPSAGQNFLPYPRRRWCPPSPLFSPSWPPECLLSCQPPPLPPF